MDVINVFISSSFHEDFCLGFQMEREALKSVMAKNQYLNDISLDYGDPQMRGSVEESLARVKDADLIILFIGTRYGGIVEEEDISLTHLEYRKAIEWDKHVLVYVFPNNPEHEEYAKTAQFINEIETNNKQTYTKAMDLLSAKHQYTIPGYKAGFIPISNEAEHEIELYSEALSLQIVSKISEELQKIQKKLPSGIIEISDNEDEKSKYKQYLSNIFLPYISRSKFKEEKEVSDIFKTEEDFYDELFVKDKYDGVLISGEGGVGKTRLMFELARKAQQEGWKSYQIFSNFQGWNTLKLNKEKKYCFIIDYVEETQFFENDIIDILDREYPGVIIKVVANARSSYLLNSDIKHERLSTIHLELEDRIEKEYLRYVVYNVFKTEGIDLDLPTNNNLKTLSQKPSFAVFLLQGLLKNGSTDFHEFSGFPEYIAKRFALTMESDTFSNINIDIFKVLCALPLKEEILSSELDQELIIPLYHDGWIEYDDVHEVYKSSYNDTIMDEILIQYFQKQIFKKGVSKLKKELMAIFDFSIKYSKFEHAFRMMDRIHNLSKTLKKNSALIKDVLTFFVEYIHPIKHIFVHTSLMTPFHRLKFIIENKILDPDTHEYKVLLAKAMLSDQLLEEEKENILLEFKKTLKNKENIILEFGVFIVPAYLKFFGEDDYIRDQTNIWLDNNFHITKDSNFVLMAFCKYSENIDELIINRIEQRFEAEFRRDISVYSDDILNKALKKSNESIDK